MSIYCILDDNHCANKAFILYLALFLDRYLSLFTLYMFLVTWIAGYLDLNLTAPIAYSCIFTSDSDEITSSREYGSQTFGRRLHHIDIKTEIQLCPNNCIFTSDSHEITPSREYGSQTFGRRLHHIDIKNWNPAILRPFIFLKDTRERFNVDLTIASWQ